MKIRLFCAAGMSTSLLVTKMREAAKAMGIDADIEAAGETRMNEETEGCDVALLGPQIRYKLTPRACRWTSSPWWTTAP